MATATATPTLAAYPAGIDNSQRVIYAYGTLAIQASPATYATGGLPITWYTMLQGISNLMLEVQGSNLTPVMVWFTSAAVSGTTVGGYAYVWNKANNAIQLLASSGTQTAGTGTVTEEMTNGTAIPAAVSNDTILFEAVFIRNFG